MSSPPFQAQEIQHEQNRETAPLAFTFYMHYPSQRNKQSKREKHVKWRLSDTEVNNEEKRAGLEEQGRCSPKVWLAKLHSEGDL
jgi:hypothetical protein